MTDEARRRANEETLKQVFAALGTGDHDTLARLYADDFVLELPYAHPEPVHLEGLQTVGRYLAGALTTFKFTLSLTGVHDLVDPDVLIAEYTSEGVATTTGKRYANTYIGVWRFRDGRVCGTREFYDPLVAAEALVPD